VGKCLKNEYNFLIYVTIEFIIQVSNIPCTSLVNLLAVVTTCHLNEHVVSKRDCLLELEVLGRGISRRFFCSPRLNYCAAVLNSYNSESERERERERESGGKAVFS
jgi:hypothetical protein